MDNFIIIFLKLINEIIHFFIIVYTCIVTMPFARVALRCLVIPCT